MTVWYLVAGTQAHRTKFEKNLPEFHDIISRQWCLLLRDNEDNVHVRFYDEGNHPIIFFHSSPLKNNNTGSGEILLSGGEIKSTGKMTDEPCLSPRTAPCAYSDDDVVPVKEVTHSLEPSAARVKFLLSLQVF
jgi:hypothetical protein